MDKFAPDEVLRQLGGTPDRIRADLRDFAEAARRLSADRTELLKLYPNQWVAAHGGRIAAQGETFEAVAAQLRGLGIAPEKAAIRYVAKDQRILIL